MTGFPINQGAGRMTVDQEAAVAWLREEMPKAVAWAEADYLATRRARKANADHAVETGRCAIGHNWHTFSGNCGYCATAIRQSKMWLPPDPTTRKDQP